MQRWATVHMESDREQALEAVAALPDTAERESLVRLLVEIHPGVTGPLCPLLSDERARERCLSQNEEAVSEAPDTEDGTS